MQLSSELKTVIDDTIQEHKKNGETLCSVAEQIGVIFEDKSMSESEQSSFGYLLKQASLHLDEGDIDLDESFALNEDEIDFCVEHELSEKLVKKVSVANRKKGGSLISKNKDLKTRKRRASQTTGLSKSKRQRTARKAAKTRKRQKGTSVDRKAKKLRAKSMKKRKQMGL